MKLRIRGDSVRLRVTRSELEQLRRDGEVVETTRFSRASTFRYALRVDSQAQALTASFDVGEIRLSISRAAFERWLDPQEVGIDGEQPLGDGAALTLLVEKDFPCLTPRPGEDDSDAFSRREGESQECKAG